jgi:hypothetical protein
MNKILKYQEYDKSAKIIEDFAKIFINPILKESIEENQIKKILDQLAKDLKFNYQLIFTFGAGINAMYPIVLHLVKNANLNVELTSENIILLTIAALTIAYLEESKNKAGDSHVNCVECSGIGTLISNLDEEIPCHICNGTGSVSSIVTKDDARTMLEELKLRGIGNGIVKKLVTCINSIGSFLKMIFKNTPVVISTLIDLFGYTAILIPTMNAISGLINMNSWNLETLPAIIGGNLLSFGVGLVAFLLRRGFDNLANKIRAFLDSFSKKKIDTKPVDIKNLPKDFDEHEIINDNFRRRK